MAPPKRPPRSSACPRISRASSESFTAGPDKSAQALNEGQSGGIDSVSAANRVIELAEQVPAPARAPLGQDAEEILRAVREKSDAELDAMRRQLLGLDKL
jgi:hypothetical protein